MPDRVKFVAIRTMWLLLVGIGLIGNTILRLNIPPSNAYMAASSSFCDPNWYLDSGATNHVTPDLSNLSIHSEYHGLDQLSVGNGAGMPISLVGMTSFSIANNHFTFKDIFHIPQIFKNLLSVSKFTHDNDVFFLISSYFFPCQGPPHGENSSSRAE